MNHFTAESEAVPPLLRVSTECLFEMTLLQDYRKFDILDIYHDCEDEEVLQPFSQVLSASSSSSSPSSSNIVIFTAGNYWHRCVFNIQRHAASVQYQFACLSTMGGAHFLVSQDRNGHASEKCIYNALYIAKRQEVLGKLLGSTSLRIKAKVRKRYFVAFLYSC